MLASFSFKFIKTLQKPVVKQNDSFMLRSALRAWRELGGEKIKWLSFVFFLTGERVWLRCMWSLVCPWPCFVSDKYGRDWKNKNKKTQLTKHTNPLSLQNITGFHYLPHISGSFLPLVYKIVLSESLLWTFLVKMFSPWSIHFATASGPICMAHTWTTRAMFVRFSQSNWI